MTTAWPSVPLGDVLHRSEQLIDLQPDKAYKEVTVRINGKGVVQRRMVQGGEIASNRRFRAQAGQFIISRIDARHGASGIIPPELDGAIVTNDFPLFDIDNDRLSSRYLFWLTKTAPFVALCRRASEGTTNRVRLSESRFASLAICLPPRDEQCRIADRIDELSTKISEARTLRTEAEEQAQALIVSTHAALSPTKPEPLGSYLELHEDSVLIELGQPYPQVGVRGFGGGLFAKQAVVGGETTYRAFNRLYEGALVLSQVKGWEGAVAVTPRDLAGYFASPEYCTFKCKDDRCLPDYLAAIISTEFFWGRLTEATRGAGARRGRTRPEQFLRLEFSMPSIADQRKAIDIFTKIREAQSLQADTAAELDAMLPAILDKAFSGQL